MITSDTTSHDDQPITVGEPAILLGQKTAVSSVWTVSARLISRLFDLATVTILARLLSPREFGVVAIAMTLISIVEAVFEMPVYSALVRMDEIRQAHYDTAFTLSLIRGALLSCMLCALSLPYAHFYGDHRLVVLICALSLAPAARGLSSPYMAAYSKKFDFSRVFANEIGARLVAFVAATTVAFITRSYWAIAIASIISPITSTALSYAFARYRPRLSLKEMKSFSGFLGWLFGAQFISAVTWQTDRLVLGKLVSLAELGIFSNANDIAMIPLATLTGPIQGPLLSAFSVAKRDAGRIMLSYQRSASAMVAIGLPILLGESVLARQVILLLLGPKWAQAVPMLRWLAISIVPSLFCMPVGMLVMSLNRTDMFARRNALELFIKLPLVIVGAIKYGFFGVIFGRLISEVVTNLYSMILVRRLISLSLREQLLAPWRSVVSAVLMLGILYKPAASAAHLTYSGLIIQTFVLVLIGAIAYIFILLVLWFLSDRPAGLESLLFGRVLETVKKYSRNLRKPGRKHVI